MRFVPYIYFLRVPLLFAILLALFPIIALWIGDGLNPVLGGMFDLKAGAAFAVCFIATLLFGALTTVTAAVLLYGKQRYLAAPLSPADLAPCCRIGPLGIPKVVTRFIGFYSICLVLFLVGVAYGAERAGWQARALSAAGAVLAFAVLVYVIALAWNALGSKATIFIARKLTWTPQGFLIEQEPKPAAGQWPFVEPPQLQPGHGFALLMAAASLVFYLLFAFARYSALQGVEAGGNGAGWLLLPTLGSIFALVILLVWALGVLAFLLDRFRIPVFIPLALLFTITAQFNESDHYYEATNLQHTEKLHPYQALQPPDAGDAAIVVAAAGGGIRAAAWTARVLTGLVEYTSGHPDLTGSDPDRFSKSIRIISSVSGGSVGAMYFVEKYKSGRFEPGDARSVVEAAQASSLDEVAWGSVYPDLLRSLAPILLSPRIDRGWAMEKAWQRYMSCQPHNGSKVPCAKPTLASWREEARPHIRPAVIFNTTLVESGERFTLSSLDLLKAEGRRSFHDVPGYENLDLDVVTAARLSATFPWVTPVSRILDCPPRSRRYHIADGGYYDNFGIASILETLDQATAGRTPPVRRVLLIEIPLGRPAMDPKSGGNRGWFFQLFAPLQTLLKMRDAAQFSRNQTELNLLRDQLCHRGVQFQKAQFYYESLDEKTKQPSQPLSWHLTEEQKSEIENTWKGYVTRGDAGELGKVMAFLKKTPPACALPKAEASK